MQGKAGQPTDCGVRFPERSSLHGRCLSHACMCRMYATAAARQDGLLLLCGGRDAANVPLGDAYGLARHRDGRWEWAAAPGELLTLCVKHACSLAGDDMAAGSGRSLVQHALQRL